MRSRTGCNSCRKRKVKCDEARPICAQCAKGSRECVFTDEGIFRHSEIHGGRFTPWQITEGGRHHVWLNIPSSLTFLNIENPSTFDWSSPIDGETVTHHHSPYEIRLSTADSQQGRNPTLPPDDGPRFLSPNHERISRDRMNILAVYLLNHFRTTIAPWMDAIDTTSYFSSRVPLIAARTPLVKSAVCALAAKHIHQLLHLGVCSHINVPPSFAGIGQVDWHDEFIKHYNDALYAIQGASHAHGSQEPGHGLDSLLTGVALVSMCDLLDAPLAKWGTHLAPLALFDGGSYDPAASFPPLHIPREAVDSPAFRNIARQDLFFSFMTESRTLLDLDHVRHPHIGALLSRGSPHPLSSMLPDNSEYVDAEEDIKCKELLVIQSKISNFLTSGDALNHSDFFLPSSQRPVIGVTQEKLLDRWHILTSELQMWYESLPSIFRESVRVPVSATMEMTASEPSNVPIPEEFDRVWYELPFCACTMQSYHMARILLLVNQPHKSTVLHSSLSERLRSYQYVQREARRHAREICNINLSRPPDPVVAQSVQPLFVAGQVFDTAPEKDLVLHLLREVEMSIGWTTAHPITKLMEEWAGNRNDTA